MRLVTAGSRTLPRIPHITLDQEGDLAPKGFSYRVCDRSAQCWRHRVPQLPGNGIPFAFECPSIMECLETRHFANGVVPDVAIQLSQHVFASRDTVISSLDGFRWPVQVTTGMPCVRLGSLPETVLRIFGGRRRARRRQVTNRITSGLPRFVQWVSL